MHIFLFFLFTLIFLKYWAKYFNVFDANGHIDHAANVCEVLLDCEAILLNKHVLKERETTSYSLQSTLELPNQENRKTNASRHKMPANL